MAMSLITTDSSEIELGPIPTGFGHVDKVLVIEQGGKITKVMLDTSDLIHLKHMLAN